MTPDIPPSLVRDGLLLCGVAAIVIGVAWIHPPSGMIAAGVALSVIALLTT